MNICTFMRAPLSAVRTPYWLDLCANNRLSLFAPLAIYQFLSSGVMYDRIMAISASPPRVAEPCFTLAFRKMLHGS